jgi:MFS family permease
MQKLTRKEVLARYFQLRIDKSTLAVISILLIVYLTWLFAFPQFGPILKEFFNRFEALSIDKGKWIMLFFAALSFSSLATGYILDKTNKRIIPILIATPIVSLLTISFLWLKFDSAFLFAIPLGLAAGVIPVALGAYFADHTLPEDRGRIMGISIGVTMLISQIFLVTGPINIGSTLNIEIIIIGSWLLLAFVTLGFKPKEKIQEPSALKPRKGPPTKQVVLYAIPVFLFYLVAGILLSIVFPTIQYQISSSSFYLIWAIPSMIGAIFAGIQFDFRGRKFPTIIGLAITGVSVAILGIIGVSLAYLILIPLAIGFSFVTVSSLIIWADLAPARSRGLFYGIGFALITASQMVGLILAGTRFGSASTSQINAYMLFSSIALFLCIPPLLLAEEALPKELIEKRQLADYLGGFKNKITKKKPT